MTNVIDLVNFSVAVTGLVIVLLGLFFAVAVSYRKKLTPIGKGREEKRREVNADADGTDDRKRRCDRAREAAL